MEESVRRRVVELEQAEKDTAMQLMAIKTVLAELRALLQPAPILSGDALNEQTP
jgi:hypothetical protein